MIRNYQDQADLLIHLRRRYNITQTQAGELIFTKLRTFQRYESGEREMHPQLLEALENKLSGKWK